MSDADTDRHAQLLFHRPCVISYIHHIGVSQDNTNTRTHPPSCLILWEHTDTKENPQYWSYNTIQHNTQTAAALRKSPRCRISTFQPRHKLDIMSLIEVQVIAGMFYWIARERAGDVLSLMWFSLTLLVL